MSIASSTYHLELKEPGTALVNNGNNKIVKIKVPAFDPIISVDKEARSTEACHLLSMMINSAEHTRAEWVTDDSIAGASCVLRRVLNLISTEVASSQSFLCSESDLSSPTS